MIAESALHAYADGELDDNMRQEVEAWLAEHPDDLERVAEWRQQGHDLRLLYGSVLDEPMPLSILKTARRFPGRVQVRSLLQMAAAVLLLVCGAAAGWMVATKGPEIPGTQWAQKSWPEFAQYAVQAHGLYAQQKSRVVEVPAKQRSQLVRWLSQNVGHDVTPPNLRGFGFALIGGRLLPSSKTAAAQFMYQNKSGTRLTVYISEKEAGRHEDLRFWKAKQGGCFFWFGDTLAYAVTAQLEEDALKKVVEKVQDHYGPNT